MKEKPLIWIASSKKDLADLPEDIIDEFGYGFHLAQHGQQHDSAKIMKGFGGAGVLELIENDAAGTYRAVYTIQMKNAVFVLHVFQKKSKHGIATPQKDIDLIKQRLKQAQIMYNELYMEKKR